MGRPRKPTEQRQGRGTVDVVLAEPAALPSIPKPPAKLSEKAARLWFAFWLSDVSRAVDADTDAFAVERWITYVEEFYMVQRKLKGSGLTVTGSTGQIVLHPLAKHRATLEASISALEKQLGLTPAARAQLGIAINNLKRGAAEALDDVIDLPPEAF